MIKATVRWSLNSDMDCMLKIEKNSFAHPWDRQDFLNCLRKKDHNGIVVEHKKTKLVVGYLMFQMVDDEFRIVNMAVDPKYRLQGYGRLLVEYLQKRLNSEGAFSKKRVKFVCSDLNLDCHLFSKSTGFRAVKVVHNHFGPNHDGYEFMFNCEAVPAVKVVKRKSVKTKSEK